MLQSSYLSFLESRNLNLVLMWARKSKERLPTVAGTEALFCIEGEIGGVVFNSLRKRLFYLIYIRWIRKLTTDS